MAKKEKIQLCIIAIFAALLVLATVRLINKGRKKELGKVLTSPVTESFGQNEPEDGRGLFFKLDEYSKNLKVMRDPFQKSVKRIFPAGPQLRGIVWDVKSPRAIIDGEIVGIGDTVRGKTIVDIQKDAVILRDGQRNTKLRIEL